MDNIKKDINIANEGYGINTYIYPITENEYDKETVAEFKIYQDIDFNSILNIVNSVYDSMISNLEIMYAIRQPLICYHIMNLLTNVDVSDVIDNEDNVNMDKAFALSISCYGSLIYSMGNNGTYNIVYVINQLLDKKLEELNRFLDNDTPVNEMCNEATLAISKFNNILDNASKIVEEVDSKALSKQLLKFTPKAMVDAYLNSAFTKNKTNEVLDAKNEEIRDLKEQLNKYTSKNVMANNIVEMPTKSVPDNSRKLDN